MEHGAVDKTDTILALECLPCTELVIFSLILPPTAIPYKDWVTSEITKDPYSSYLTGGYYAHFLKRSSWSQSQNRQSTPLSLIEKWYLTLINLESSTVSGTHIWLNSVGTEAMMAMMISTLCQSGFYGEIKPILQVEKLKPREVELYIWVSYVAATMPYKKT